MIDFAVEFENGYPRTTLKSGDAMKSNIALSLLVRRGTLFVNLNFGSDLHTIKKVTAGNVALAETYSKSALKWLLDTGRAKRIDTRAARDNLKADRIKIYVAVTTQDNRLVEYEHYHSVV